MYCLLRFVFAFSVSCVGVFFFLSLSFFFILSLFLSLSFSVGFRHTSHMLQIMKIKLLIISHDWIDMTVDVLKMSFPPNYYHLSELDWLTANTCDTIATFLSNSIAGTRLNLFRRHHSGFTLPQQCCTSFAIVCFIASPSFHQNIEPTKSVKKKKMGSTSFALNVTPLWFLPFAFGLFFLFSLSQTFFLSNKRIPVPNICW